MPWPVYSERFCYTEAPSSPMSYVVPEGMRAVITSVTGGNIGAAGALAQIKAHGIVIAFLHFPVDVYTRTLELYSVVYGGESMEVIAITSGVSAYVSGYLLSDPSNASGPPGGPGPPPQPPPLPRPNEAG